MAITNEGAFHRKFQAKLAGERLEAAEQINKEPVGKEVKPTQKRWLSSFSVQNILWLIVAAAVLHLTEFHVVVRYDPRIIRLWFNFGAAFVGLTLAIALFLIVWVSFVKKKSSDDWEKDYPAAIPVSTASFILGFLCILRGLWPVWGLLTPLILGALFMGVVVLIAMMG